MATSKTRNLRLTLQDDNEFISLNKIRENFQKIDDAIGEDRDAIDNLDAPPIVEAATLETVFTDDTPTTRWGKVKKAISDFIAHLTSASAHATATQSAAGFMSAADKEKLDGIEAGATRSSGSSGSAYTHPNYLGSYPSTGLYKFSANASGHLTSVAAVTAADIEALGFSQGGSASGPVIKTGTVSVTVPDGSIYANFSVSFSGFSSSPVVLVGSSNPYLNAAPSSVSANGFSGVLTTPTAERADGAMSANVRWVAIGS